MHQSSQMILASGKPWCITISILDDYAHTVSSQNGLTYTVVAKYVVRTKLVILKYGNLLCILIFKFKLVGGTERYNPQRENGDQARRVFTVPFSIELRSIH